MASTMALTCRAVWPGADQEGVGEGVGGPKVHHRDVLRLLVEGRTDGRVDFRRDVSEPVAVGLRDSDLAMQMGCPWLRFVEPMLADVAFDGRRDEIAQRVSLGEPPAHLR